MIFLLIKNNTIRFRTFASSNLCPDPFESVSNHAVHGPSMKTQIEEESTSCKCSCSYWKTELYFDHEHTSKLNGWLVQNFLNETSHLAVLNLFIVHQELVVKQLCIVCSFIHFFIQANWNKVTETVWKLSRRKGGGRVHTNIKDREEFVNKRKFFIDSKG